MRSKPQWMLALLVAFAFAYTPQAQAGGVVSTCDETSLSNALAGGGNVGFTCSGTIFLTNTITILSNTTIDGRVLTIAIGGGAADGSFQTVTISGRGTVQVLSVPSGVTLNLKNLTIANGTRGITNFGTLTVSNSTISGNNAGFGNGGGIEVSGGTLTVTNSTFSNNSADEGGGINLDNGGPVIVTNSTFVGNSASSQGGGINNDSGGGTVTVINSTLFGNSATFGGGIISSGTMILKNTIVANSPSGGNCGITIVDGGGNLSWPVDGTCPGIHADPLLDPNGLQNNGGPTQSIALTPASPAVDAALDANCPATDQRGVTRPQGPHCDIGAYELIEQSTPVGPNVTVPLNGGSTAPGGVSVTFNNVTAAGNTTLAPSSAGPTPPGPGGFNLGSPATYYSLTTTATFSAPVTICFNYAGITFSSTPQLFHFEGGAWVNVTTSVDTVNQIVCGSVTSLSPFGLFQATISSLMALVNSFNLPHGTADSLLAKLDNAQASVTSGNLTAACNQLNAFTNEVEAQSGKKITADQANQLIVAANGVKAGLGCQ